MIFKRILLLIAVCGLVAPAIAQDDATVEEVIVWGERAAELNARQAEREKDRDGFRIRRHSRFCT